MRKDLYRPLMVVAVVLTVAWLGWTIYTSFLEEDIPGDFDYLTGNTDFEDGYYERALESYQAALEANPDHIHALRGKARSLMQLGRNEEALEVFDQCIAATPKFGASYANRGILHDRMGDYDAAIADYEQALRLDPELGEGPGLLTRFLRNQAERPPTISDRLRYLREQMALPESERVLRVPDQDAAQRPYKK